MHTDNINFQLKAEMLIKNVMDIPENLTEYISDKDNEMFYNGFKALRKLIINILSDTESYTNLQEDLHQYNALLSVLNFLYTTAIIGDVEEQGAQKVLRVKKDELKKIFKKKINDILPMLNKQDVYLEWMNGDQVYKNFKDADSFIVRFECEGGNDIVPTISYFAKNIPEKNDKNDDMNRFSNFVKVDCNSLSKSYMPSRKKVNPLNECIMRSSSPNGKVWERIVEIMNNEGEFINECNFYHYFSPQWIIRFQDIKGKKNKCIYYICNGNIEMWMSFTAEEGKKLIINRNRFSEKFKGFIEKFGCCNCGRCKGIHAISIIDGIALCEKSAEGRLINFRNLGLNDLEDIITIFNIIKKS